MAALRALLASLLLAVSFSALTVTPAEACTCAPLTLEERVARANLIVIGTTTDQRSIGPLPTPRPTPKPGFPADLFVSWSGSIETELTVEEYVKGAGPTELALGSVGAIWHGPDGEIQITPGGGAGCSLVPEVGVRYLFFLLSSDDSRHVIGSCDGHVRITAGDEAALARVEEIRQLAQQPPPTPTVGALPDTGLAGTDSDSHVFLPLIAAAGAGAVLLATGIFSIRRTSVKDEN